MSLAHSGGPTGYIETTLHLAAASLHRPHPGTIQSPLGHRITVRPSRSVFTHGLSGSGQKIPSAALCRRRRPGSRHPHPDERPQPEPHRPRLHLLRPSRHRQDHHRPHRRPGPQLPHRNRHRGPPHARALRRLRFLHRDSPGQCRRRDRDRRRHQSRHRRDSRTPRRRPLRAQHAIATRSTSSTRPTRSPTPPSTPCSRPSKSRRRTSSS